MARITFRKTDAGQAEIRERKAGLEGRLRTLLILCNGQLAESELAAQVGGDVREPLQRLIGLGLIAIVRPEGEALPPPPPPPAAPAPQAATPPAVAALSEERRRMVVRARGVLDEFYGPGGGVEELRPLLHAREGVELEAVLAHLQELIESHQGRKRAEQLMRHIRTGA